MQQSSDITCHNDICVVCLICPWSWSLVLKAPTPRKPCTSKHYSLRYGEHCVFSHNFCIFPSISVPSRSYSHCLCCLVDSLNRLALLAVCESPDRFQMWLTLATQFFLPVAPRDFLTFVHCPAHLSPPLPPTPRSTCCLLPVVTFPSVPLPPPLSPFLFCLLRIQNMCALFLMSRLVYDSGWILYCWLCPAPCIRNPCGPVGFLDSYLKHLKWHFADSNKKNMQL